MPKNCNCNCGTSWLVEDLSDLRDRGPEFKTGSRPLTFTKAFTALTNPAEIRQVKDVKIKCIES
jgi:hypothetical protein